MIKKTMISVHYDRLPQQELYKSKIEVDRLVVVEGVETREEPIRRVGRDAVTLEEVIADLHQILKKHPDAVVTMVRGTTRPTHFGQQASRGFELDTRTRDLIRDDLEKAKKAFAPIDRMVRVRPTSPSIASKGVDDD